MLAPDQLTAASEAWGDRLGIAPRDFLAALFDGNDDQVLIGRTTEETWWSIVAGRLRVGTSLIAKIQRDLDARQTWDTALLTCLRNARGAAAIAIVSNAWPAARRRLAEAGILDVADAVVLSCEVGCAKPDPRIYEIALQGLDPAQALFIDDTPGHVEAARSLGMAGHVHTGTAATVRRIEAFTT